MKREQLYISTVCDITSDAAGTGLAYRANAAPVARKYGLGLELAEYCVSENMEDDSPVRAHFEANAAAVERRVFHAPYNELYPHAIEPKAVELARMRYAQALKLCEGAGCEKMIVHANFLQALYHPAWFIERQILFWKRFLEEHPSHVVICIENVMEPEPKLLTDIVEGVNDPRLRLCIDLGHANLMPVKPTQWLRACGKYTSHFHLHNNGGPASEGWPCLADTHSALNRGSIDYESLLREAEALAPNATYALETAAAAQSVEWLIEKGFL